MIYLEEGVYPFRKTERGGALKAKVDSALTKIHEDGTLSRLVIQWVGYDISKKHQGEKQPACTRLNFFLKTAPKQPHIGTMRDTMRAGIRGLLRSPTP